MHAFLRFSCLAAFFFSTVILAEAGEIKGHVYEASTKEQSIGSLVTIKPLNKTYITGLDGAFSFKDLEAGSYEIHIENMGYESLDTTIDLSTDVITIDFYEQPQAKELMQVEIKTKAEGGSEAFANNKEKNADNIMNVLSARAIQVSPDITVAEVMQRVSGVSVESSNSGSQFAVIRGMDKRYNTTLVNGIKIPSPDDKDRYIPLDIFPAELLDRLEVIKSLTPGMEADATGGSINLVMKDAPQHLLLEANVALGYNTAFFHQDFQKFSRTDINKKSPAEILGPGVYAPVSAFPSSNLVTSKLNLPVNSNISLSLGNRFFKDKLGVLISGSYQSMYSGSETNMLVQGVVSAPSNDVNTNNLPQFSDIDHRTYSILSQRLGLIARADYKFNDKNKISLFGTHIQMNQYRTRETIDSVPGGSNFNNEWVNVIGVKYRTETRSTLQSIDNITLQGTHQLTNDFSADWSLVASEAKRQLPNDAEFGYDKKLDIQTDPTTKQQSYVTGLPYFNYVTGQSDEWQHNTDKDLAAYLNLHYNVHFIPFVTSIEAGGLYRHKDRDNYDNKYSLNQFTDASGYQEFTTIPAAVLQFTRQSDALGNAAGNAGIYTFKENLTAYYIQAHINIGSKFRLLGGLRAENTQQSYVSSLPPTIAGQMASYNYTDLLPSIQGKYDLSQKGGIRFSYFKSVYRPAYSDLIPFPNAAANDNYVFQGNPYLLHSSIHNADVRYEIFPKGLDEFMIGGFYKYIINPIEYSVQPQTKTDQVLTPGNFGNATNLGLEVVLRKFIGNFGVSANYTYTHSNINSTKVVYYKEDGVNGAVYANVNQSRPLQGQAANIGNLAFLYKNKKQQLEAQIAFVYTGSSINTVSYYRDLDVWQKAMLNMDFSLQKQINRHFIVYAKAKNILNTGNQLFIKQPNTSYKAPSKLPYQESADYYTIEKDYYHSSLLLGLRYKFN